MKDVFSVDKLGKASLGLSADEENEHDSQGQATVKKIKNASSCIVIEADIEMLEICQHFIHILIIMTDLI